jgi:hypothetical protein
MKKIITLLLVLVTLNGYSQTKQEIKDYYMEVTSPVRFFNEDESDGIFGCDSTKQIKFQEDVYIYVWGDKREFIMEELNVIVSELNNLIDPINIYITEDSILQNIILYIGDSETYYDDNYWYQKYIDRGGIKPFGYANALMGLENIQKGLAFVDIDYIESKSLIYGWDTTSTNNQILGTLREEVTQLFGFMHDSYSYPNSIFQEFKEFPVTEYSNIDKEVIKMLYNN